MYKIYLIYAEIDATSQYKIGITNRDIKHRLIELRVANPNIVDVIATYEISDRKIAYQVEAALKRHFKFERVGEWIFKITINEFIALCDKYKHIAEINVELKNNLNKIYDN